MSNRELLFHLGSIVCLSKKLVALKELLNGPLSMGKKALENEAATQSTDLFPSLIYWLAEESAMTVPWSFGAEEA